MAAPIPTTLSDLAAPAAPAPEVAAPVAPEPAPAPVAELEDPGDRILTPQETENLLRGVELSTNVEPQTPETPMEEEQADMAADFFSDPTIGEAGTTPTAPRPDLETAVQDTLQQGAPQPVAPVAPVAPGVPVQAPVQPQMAPELAAVQTELQLMRQQNELLLGQLNQLQPHPLPLPGQAPAGAVHPGQAAPQVAPQAAPAPPAAPTYGFQVPTGHMEALGHEDLNVRTQALNGLLNGVAEAVSTQLRGEMAQGQSGIPDQVDQRLARAMQQQHIANDMYGTYPELAQHKTYVQTAAAQLKGKYGDKWSPDLRDEIAAQLAPLVPTIWPRVQQNRATRVVPGTAPVAQPQLQPQPLPPQQPTALPPGVSPVGVVGGQHVAPQQGVPARGQMLMRDTQGNLFPVAGPPQPYLGSPQARQNGGAVPADSQIADIWRTLDF